jgi:hypothetical protein
MANINLTNDHKPLVKAAVSLGDWLCSLPEVKQSDIELIKTIQTSLSRLPKISDGTLAMFGFSIERGNEQAGLVRGWDVSIEYFANDPQQQGGLEIFSSYIPLPETTDKSVLANKKQAEVYFHWPVGDTCSLITADQKQQWIEEVTKPEQFLQAGDRLRVELVFGQQYAEIECIR